MKRRFMVMVLSGCLLAAAPTAAFAHGGDDLCARSHGGRVVLQFPSHGGRHAHNRDRFRSHGGTIVRGARVSHGGRDCDGD